MRYGAGRDQRGVVLMLTFGTGIGSALFVDGHLVPNTEFGHIQVDGEDGERRASAAAREREDLDYPKWAKRVDRYLDVLEAGLWPDLIIVGGGVSKNRTEQLRHPEHHGQTQPGLPRVLLEPLHVTSLLSRPHVGCVFEQTNDRPRGAASSASRTSWRRSPR